MRTPGIRRLTNSHFIAMPSSEYDNLKAPDTPNRKFDGDGSSKKSRIPRPSSTEARLIINVYRNRCLPFMKAQVLDEEILNVVPEQLRERGITQGEWVLWMMRFKEIIQDHALSITTTAALVVTLIGILALVVLNNRLQAKVGKLLKDFNRDVMEPRNMFIKAQKSFIQVDKYHDEVAWLAIALNDDEVQALRGESHVFHYNFITKKHVANDGCLSCFNTIGGVRQMV